MHRRTLLKALLGGTAIAVAPVLLAIRKEDIWALLRRKIADAEVGMADSFARRLFADGTSDFEGGLKTLFREHEGPDVVLVDKNAMYEWQKVTGRVTFTGAG